MQKITLYSKKDISIWKTTNVVCLYINIKNNEPTFEINHNSLHNGRAMSMKKMIIDTLKKHQVNDVEILINLTDLPYNHPYILSFSSTTNANITTVPNFSFYEWEFPVTQNFFDIKKDILSSSVSWEDKEDKIMWSGLNTHSIRERFSTYVKDSNFYEFNLIDTYNNKNNKYYKLTDHTKYKYLLDLEGRGYSGRFPYLALTGSCIILLENSDPERDYKLYYSNDFIENIHFLKIQYTTEDTIENIHNKIQVKINTNNCKKIGLDCQELASSIFTLDNILLYMSKVLNYYSENYKDSETIFHSEKEYSVKTLTQNTKLKLINYHKTR
jgi:hypothetical protein